ncbi:ABC transporter ATP-binding protein [Serpentinicella alkaliphila]|uniref:Nucleoside ABC transporter ATP-binding protein n=1 Tax=Serpentinicella alkaliphila TaxID=1734049 RepID=A0A4R2SZ75_9FIRM|nr:ABC transporter ATP-binding protein [Serpentinicella alkaliphila]QUH27144.1 ABC transporter ATP-binding protein [Serpentinicella alkaliphila]TCP95040.1 nucleoside ABC transporter ATP-binding protein [Serpentinicella alkaliphila]
MIKGMSYISMQGITKTFGKVIANQDVNLTVNSGEIHALLGENGAGKSTLMNMLSGIYTPDGGSIFILGEEVKFASPKDSINAGIGMIHQHFKLVDVLTAKENIILGQKTGLFLNQKKLTTKIKEVSLKFGLDVDPDKKVYDMSVGEKQTLEILKVLYRGANILILDEPTAVLTPQETAKLFKIMQRMKDEGCAVIFISHKMNEVMEVADRITVLRKGNTIRTLDKINTNPKELTDLMVGRSVDLEIKRLEIEKQDIVLNVSNLRVLNEEKVEGLKGLNFNLRSGEILGVAGIAGSGQKELCEAIAGLYPVKSGQIIFKGDNLIGKSPKEIITKGISMSFIPEDRLGMGLVASMDMVDNLILKQYQNQKGWLIDRKPAAKKALELIDKLEIKTPGINHPIRDLSGGNIQKVLLGRELDSNPDLIITAYPVRGLDINASHMIYDLLNEEKQKGVAILFVAEDLDVLIELCDRIMVLCDGEITGIIDAKEATREKLGLLMVGEKLDELEVEHV